MLNTEVTGGRASILDAIMAPGDGGGRPEGVMTIHQTLQPVIDVADDGESARFRVRLLGSSGTLGGSGAWIAGVYVGDASWQGEAWQLDRMDLYLTWAADYKEGWSGAAPFARIASVPLD